jgi:hypothetical protein
MRIPLSDFNVPGVPGVDGEVAYKAIDYDVNSGKDCGDGHVTYAYFVCGWREDDGAGVLIHGTQHGGDTRYDWRVPRLISAPDDEDHGLTVTRTEFHGVESLEGHFVRLVGCVETAEAPGKKRGFLYEGIYDGSGDWYPISIPDSEETVVKASEELILVCDDNSSSDSVHVYSLDSHEWTELHCGYADPWEVDEIIPAGEVYVIRLLHSDGKRSDVAYRPGK